MRNHNEFNAALEVEGEGQNDIVGRKSNYNARKRERRRDPMEDGQDNDDEKTIISIIPKPPKKKKQKTNHEKPIEFDQWDAKSVPLNVELRDRTITAKKLGYCYSCGTRSVELGIFRWRFRINNVSSQWTDIGVVSKGNHNLYSFEVMGGNVFDINGSRQKYGSICKAGSIIEMILDLDRSTLRYIIDGMDYGIAHDVEKAEYRARVCLVQPGESVTMLSE